ncbi:hypothetical protein [uncultured Gilliamella sp.]|uniref:hypothetical protein n=1 Tax=uncultured Gilliamella sp. TaxID=1193505 RepID=UPI0025F021C2|nr:hypothetical protein [uncultured Gilliamella sp.]
MNTNFIFNRFLQLTGLSKKSEVTSHILAIGGYPNVNKNKIGRWSKINPESSGYEIMPDQVFAGFVRGLLGYIRIQQSKGVKVFDFEDDFIEDVIAMFFDYRNEMSEAGIDIFNFN